MGICAKQLFVSLFFNPHVIERKHSWLRLLEKKKILKQQKRSISVGIFPIMLSDDKNIPL